jgi:hypothetical protein
MNGKHKHFSNHDDERCWEEKEAKHGVATGVALESMRRRYEINKKQQLVPTKRYADEGPSELARHQLVSPSADRHSTTPTRMRQLGCCFIQ